MLMRSALATALLLIAAPVEAEEKTCRDYTNASESERARLNDVYVEQARATIASQNVGRTLKEIIDSEHLLKNYCSGSPDETFEHAVKVTVRILTDF